MTEAEWATSYDLIAMLAHLRVDPDSPKALRFAEACCRRAHMVLPEVCWTWVARADRVAEDDAALADFRDGELFERISDSHLAASQQPGGGLGRRAYAVWSVVAPDWFHEWHTSKCPEWAAERTAKADLARSMFTYK